MSSRGHVYIALSTGQNIANLLPILELYTPGDLVLWLESALARNLDWTAGPRQILDERGIPHQTLFCADNDPATLHQTVADYLAREGPARVRLIANGGTKLQMLAAFRALAGRLDEVLYGQFQPCVLERYPQDGLAAVGQQFYVNHQLQFKELVACNGMEILEGKQECIWPGAPLPIPLFGQDAAHTQDCYSRVWEWRKAQEPPSAPPVLPYEAAANLAPEQTERFHTTIRNACHLSHTQPIKINEAKAIYHSAGRLDREARLAWPASAQGVEARPNIGLEFEQAVAARLVNWLIATPALHRVVQSVWRNVLIRKQGAKDIRAELDIALLLRSGVLLHLECKSWDANRKDIDARFSTLRDISSQLARLAICLPSFHGMERTEWHLALLRNLENIHGWNQHPIIRFTLPDTPDEEGYQFEDYLARWLRPYLPRAVSGDEVPG